MHFVPMASHSMTVGPASLPPAFYLCDSPWRADVDCPFTAVLHYCVNTPRVFIHPTAAGPGVTQDRAPVHVEAELHGQGLLRLVPKSVRRQKTGGLARSHLPSHPVPCPESRTLPAWATSLSSVLPDPLPRGLASCHSSMGFWCQGPGRGGGAGSGRGEPGGLL